MLRLFFTTALAAHAAVPLAAAAVEPCPRADVEKLLVHWDRSQREIDVDLIKQIALAEAEFHYVAGNQDHKRGRDVFIGQMIEMAKAARDGQVRMLAYAFEPSEITCLTKSRIRVERRGCIVVRDTTRGLIEGSQTEEIDLRSDAQTLKIELVKTTAHSHRENSRALMVQQRPDVNLKECADAVGNQN